MSTNSVFKGISQLFHTLCKQLSLLLAEPSPWFKLSCNKLASEMFLHFLSLGPVIYSRNACNDIGNQGNQAEYYQTLDLDLVTGRFLLDTGKMPDWNSPLVSLRCYQSIRVKRNCRSLLNFSLAIKYLFTRRMSNASPSRRSFITK